MLPACFSAARTMNIITIFCARNEADILETCVRHYARWSKKIFVVLHQCQDNSAEIIGHLQDEGLPIECSIDTGLLHEQAAMMTELLYRAADAGADWILPVDTDEFIVGDISRVLAEQDGLTPVRVPWKSYVPMPGDLPSEQNVLKRITHRRASEHPPWAKVIVPMKLLKDGTGKRLYAGNHGVMDGCGNPVPDVTTSLAMAHFPVRSAEQIKRKIYGGWLTNFADPRKPHGNTFQWKAIFEEMKRNDTITPEDLKRYALEYGMKIQWNRLPASYLDRGDTTWIPWDGEHETEPPVLDPVPCDFDLRYDVHEVEPIAVLLETAEAFATAYGECTFSKHPHS